MTVIGGERPFEPARVEQHRVAVALRRDAHLREELEHRRDVAQPGNVAEPERCRGEQRGAHERERRVLGAGDADLAAERHSALES